MKNNIGNFIEKAKDVFSQIENKIIEFYDENRKTFFILVSMIFVIFICLVLLIILPKSNREKKSSKKNVFEGEKLELSEKAVIPNSPELPKDYNYSRLTKEKWSDEDAQIYFTVPSQKEIDSLSKTNDKMINEITGAAP